MKQKSKNSFFSSTELKIIKIIGRRKRTIADITFEFYKGGTIPFAAGNSIALTVRRIKNKCKYYDLNWTIDGVGGGRAGRTVWRKYV